MSSYGVYGYVCGGCDHPSSRHLSVDGFPPHQCELCSCTGTNGHEPLTRKQWCDKFGHLVNSVGNCRLCRSPVGEEKE